MRLQWHDFIALDVDSKQETLRIWSENACHLMNSMKFNKI